jgi:hypothetical protein
MWLGHGMCDLIFALPDELEGNSCKQQIATRLSF